MPKHSHAHEGPASPSAAKSADEIFAQFTAQAQEERAAGASADNDAEVLVQAGRAVALAVDGDQALAAALQTEDVDEAYLHALTRRADALFALRAQAPSDLKSWTLLSPTDKQLVADVGAWLRNRIERVQGAARAQRKPELAERFGRPSRGGGSPQALLGSIRDFRLAAREQPA